MSKSIDEISQNIQARLGYLQRIRLLYLFFKNKQDEYNILLDKIKKNELPANQLRVFAFNLAGDLARYINDRTQPLPPFVARIIIGIKNDVDEYSKTMTLKYQVKVHQVSQNYENALNDYNNTLREKQIAETKLNDLTNVKAAYEDVEANTNLKQDLEKIKANILNLDQATEDVKELNDKFEHAFPVDLKVTSQPSDVETLMLELNSKINVLYNKDKLINSALKNITDLEDTNSDLGKKIAKVNEVNKTSGFDAEITKLDAKIDEFKAVAKRYGEDYKYSIFYSVLVREGGILGNKPDSTGRVEIAKQINESTLSSNLKYLFKAFLENIDNLKIPTNIQNVISSYKDAVKVIIDELQVKYSSTLDAKNELISTLNAEFNKTFAIAFEQLNNDINTVAEQTKKLDDAVSKFNKELIKNDVKDELISYYTTKLTNITRELSSIVTSDDVNTYIAALFPILDHAA
ncbi:UNVERIFIED_CONTAM: hypothetical protein O8I53_06225 [Campylobacter lari]